MEALTPGTLPDGSPDYRRLIGRRVQVFTNDGEPFLAGWLVTWAPVKPAGYGAIDGRDYQAPPGGGVWSASAVIRRWPGPDVIVIRGRFTLEPAPSIQEEGKW